MEVEVNIDDEEEPEDGNVQEDEEPEHGGLLELCPRLLFDPAKLSGEDKDEDHPGDEVE